jgi:hypothetical protein
MIPMGSARVDRTIQANIASHPTLLRVIGEGRE